MYLFIKNKHYNQDILYKGKKSIFNKRNLKTIKNEIKPGWEGGSVRSVLAVRAW